MIRYFNPLKGQTNPAKENRYENGNRFSSATG